MSEWAALAEAGVSALLKAAATDAWESVRTGFARPFERRDRRSGELIRGRLDDVAATLEKTECADRDRVNRDLLSAWRTRLSDLLEEYPAAASDLRTLVEEVRATVTDARQARVQSVCAHAGATAFEVMGGNQFVHLEGQQGPSSVAPDDDSSRPSFDVP